MKIVGVSFDDTDALLAWTLEEGFEFELWSDVDKTLALYYGAATSESAYTASRVTMLLDANGDLLLEYTEGVDYGTHPAEVLADCQALFQ